MAEYWDLYDENRNSLNRTIKRGDKFKKAIEAGKFDELSDIGLRYDLTLPLSRYYACHKANLPSRTASSSRVLPVNTYRVNRGVATW